MTKTELENQLNNGEQYKEIWIENSSRQCICALLNGDIGLLIYLSSEGDVGFSSRNPVEISNENIEFYLSNGQRDEYPKKWTYSIKILKEALFSFIENGQLPKQVKWHNDAE